MLHRSARRLLGRARRLTNSSYGYYEVLFKAAGSPTANLTPGVTSALLHSFRAFSSNGGTSGFQGGTPKSILSWVPRSYSTTTQFGKVQTLQQSMTEMANDVVGLPSEIRYEDLVVSRSEHLQVKPRLDEVTLKFGAIYTDHMLQVSWKDGVGWTVPSIDPLGPLTLHPCAQVLHYGVQCFEGMKAYKGKDGRLRLFRPNMNMDRLSRSAARLTLPQFDKAELLECIKELLRVEREWVPDEEGFSVYIRPTLIGTHPFLGVCPTMEAMLFVVLSPVGPYFPSGLKPVKLFVDTENVRAFPGGVGDKKIGGNYAPTLLPQLHSSRRGCSQVLYVLKDGDGKGGLVGESGAMNMFFLFRQAGELELVTPPLDGLILPGVTRDTVLTLARAFGKMKVSERHLHFDEIEDAGANGRLVEAFGTGTACMIQPIMGLLKNDDTEIPIPFDNDAASYWLNKPPASAAVMDPSPDEPFSLCGRLTRALLDIQYGHVDSEWSVVIDP